MKLDNKKGALAISQILILVIGIVAISYAVGGGIGMVSGLDIYMDPTTKTYHEEYKSGYVKVIGYKDGKVLTEEIIQDKVISPKQGLPLPTDTTPLQTLPISGTETISGEIFTYKNQEWFVTKRGNVGEKITAINQETGLEQTFTRGSETVFQKATTIQAKFGKEIITLSDGTKTTVANAIKTNNIEALKKVDGITGIKTDETGKIIGFEQKGNLYNIGVNGETLTTTKFAPLPFGGKVGALFGHIGQGLMWAGAVVGALQLIGGFLGEDAKATINALSTGAFVGIMAGKTLTGALQQINPSHWRAIPDKGWLGMSRGGAIGTGFGIAIGVLIFLCTYKKTSQEIVTFDCRPWDAPVGGNDCDKCNKQDLPCSEYQCRSLGQACVLENPGTNEEMCVWQHRNDVNPPEIRPWVNALLEDYKYERDNTVSPPDYGEKIINTESTTGCVKAFTPLTLGISTNEPAKCKVDYVRKDSFDGMNFFFGGSSLFRYNHTQMMSLPGPSALASENLTLQNNGEYELYIRCADSNGNSNTANFVFKFCVEKGPDTTPPLIVATDLLNNMPIAHNQTNVDIEVYTNEPATCRWGHVDQSYNDLTEEMTCSSSVLEINAKMLYKCSTTLTGIKDRVTNKFYFRCEDKPTAPESDRNVNSESYEFNLIGTQPLVIDWVKPNKTIKDSTETVKVSLEAKTSAGHKDGEATCYYSDTGETDSYVKFFESGSYQHKQDLYLLESSYEYFIKCIDLGGNSDVDKVNFNVESDSEAPIVVRVYKQETYLKIVTNEEAECVYDVVDCNYQFEDGIKMIVKDKTNHFTDWNTQTNFHIKCKDEYGNQPAPNECNLVARAFEIYEEE